MKDPQAELFPAVASGATKPVARAELQVAIDAFDAAYRAAYGQRPTWGAKQGAQLKRLIAAHGVEVVLARVELLFTGGLDWPAPPYTLATLVAHFDRLVQSSSGQRKQPRPSELLGRGRR